MAERADVVAAITALKGQPLAEMRTIGKALEFLLAEVEALKARPAVGPQADEGGGSRTGPPPSRG